MIRKIFLLVFGLVVSITLCAQQSDSKKINSIKRNPSYLYAEATMETEAEAFNTAKEALMAYIHEYIDSKKSLSNANNVIVKDIANRCEKMQMMRGDMYRVLVYVKKSDIIPAENTTTIDRLGNAELVDTTAIAKDKIEVKQSDTVSINTIPVDTAIVNTATIDDGLPSVDEINSKPNVFGNNNDKEAIEHNTVETAAKLEIAWQQRVIDELLEVSSLTEAKAMLNRFKAEYKVKRYGSYNECRNVGESFWLIVENGGPVKAILGPGADGRTNFKTMKTDRLGNYSGYDAIWFTLAK